MDLELKERKVTINVEEQKKKKEFLKKVKELLTEDTLNVAWVLGKKHEHYKKFELRLNPCKQFPDGHYEVISATNGREAKTMLYERLINKLEGKDETSN